jgi:hypothetical protein
VDLAFISEDLRSQCEKEAVSKRQLGDGVSRVLRSRLADLRAAASVSNLVVGRPRCEIGTSRATMAIDLSEGFELRFCANHIKSRLTESGETDWSRVSRIKILEIGPIKYEEQL